MNERVPSALRVPRDGTIPTCFAQQVGLNGGRVAIKTHRGAVTYTYDELNREANRVARTIRARPRPPLEPIALFFNQGAAEIVGLLGVLKAGHPYVPLSPVQPRAILARMLEDSTAGLIVTSADLVARLSDGLAGGLDVLALDALDSTVSPDNPAGPSSPDALASIMYTSGSTGQPKGVMQTHRVLLQRAAEFTDVGDLGPDDRVALPVSASSSASVRLIFGAMLNGAALHIFDPATEGPRALASWLAEERITIFCCVPSVFRRLAGVLTGQEAFPALRLIRLASEPLLTSDVALYQKYFRPPCVLMNALACGEAGTIAQYVVDPARPPSGAMVPVGYPADDRKLLLLDEEGAPVGAGAIGEIAVWSRILSPGYWRRPDLTQAAFLPDPDGGDARIYRTGDLGRLDADGCLEYLGRKDLRVKIRGQQVEVTQVEAALLDLGAKEAAVIARDDGSGGRRLVGYVVSDAPETSSVSRLRRTLSERLPAHMVPTAFIFLDALPRTAGGKVNRQALPPPPRSRPALETEFLAPRTPVEEAVASIWAESLGLDRVGIHDHFLDVGGDSLLAAQVVARVMQRFAADIPARTLFDAPTVAAMSLVVVQRLATLVGDEAMRHLWDDAGGRPPEVTHESM